MLSRYGTQLYRRLAYPCWKTYARYRPIASWKRRAGSDDLMPRRGGGPLRDFSPRLERMADMMDRFENEMFGGLETFFPSVTREGMRVAMDVHEDDAKYTITADLPGMSKSDVKIQVTPQRVLTISGERQTEKKEDRDGYFHSERHFGKFFRSFHLPQNANEGKISAKAEEGVLEITIPKIEKDSTSPRVIDIQ